MAVELARFTPKNRQPFAGLDCVDVTEDWNDRARRDRWRIRAALPACLRAITHVKGQYKDGRMIYRNQSQAKVHKFDIEIAKR
jgi:hypothetical protein